MSLKKNKVLKERKIYTLLLLNLVNKVFCTW